MGPVESEAWVLDDTNMSIWGNNSEGAAQQNSTLLAPISSRTNPLIALSMFIMIISIALNSFIIYAIRQGNELKKNVKFVIINSVCADMFLSLVAGTRFLPLFIAHLSDKNMDIMMCLESVYIILSSYSSINISFCSIAVAVDRLYSVHSPMQYYTTPYSKGIKMVFVSFTWLLSFILALPSVFIDWVSGVYPQHNNGCYIITLPGAFWYYSTFVASTCWAGLILSILLYVSVLALIFKARAKMSDMSDSNKDVDLLKNNLSIAVTFLCIQLTYVACYVPAALLMIGLVPLEGYYPPVDLYMNLVIFVIYSLNSVIDPLVYITRVNQIKNCLRKLLFNNRKKGKRNDNTRGPSQFVDN